MPLELEAVCEAAMREGRRIDLAGCSYGKAFLQPRFIEEPLEYYFLLAGLVRLLDLRRILELGTHWGGAIMSMWRGLRDPSSPENQLVTVDVTHANVDGFRAYPRIQRITGDSFDRAVVEAVVASFHHPVDLLFLDTDHNYRQTYRNIAIYAARLAPRFVVLDDIHLNPSMDRLWRDLTRILGDRAFDATRLCKRQSAGFGVVRWDPYISWPERYGLFIEYWRARRWVLARVPTRIKDWRRRRSRKVIHRWP